MTARNHPAFFKLTDLDLKLLKIFRTIIACNGLAPAQNALNLSLPTISAHLKQLEDRLGFKVCERGRKGFKLTEEGEQISHALANLFDSVTAFQDIVSTIRGQLSGELCFGLVDALSTMYNIYLINGFELFYKRADQVKLIVDIASPQDLLYGLIEGHYDCILTPIKPDNNAIDYMHVFSETHHLYCGKQHYLYNEENPNVILEALPTQPLAGRSYMTYPQLADSTLSAPSAIVSHMESAILLIFSGQYLGYLPGHLGNHWQKERRVRALLPDILSFDDKFYLATLKQNKSRATDVFYRCMRESMHQTGAQD